MVRGVKDSMLTAAEAAGAGAAVVDVVAVADAGEAGVVDAVAVVDVCGDAAGTGMAGSTACPLDDIVLDDAGAIGGDAA
jgi:hypothetical protein